MYCFLLQPQHNTMCVADLPCNKPVISIPCMCLAKVYIIWSGMGATTEAAAGHVEVWMSLFWYEYIWYITI